MTVQRHIWRRSVIDRRSRMFIDFSRYDLLNVAANIEADFNVARYHFQV